MQITNNGERKRAVKRVEYLDDKLKSIKLMLDKLLLNNLKSKQKNKLNLTYIKSIKENIESVEKVKHDVLQEIQKFDEYIIKKKEEKLKNAKAIK